MRPIRFRIRLLAFCRPYAMQPARPGAGTKGRLEWQHKVDMRTVENGVVEEVNVTTGQHVNKGDLLLRMDQRKQQATLLEAKARVARAKLSIEDAEREQARTQELFDRGLIAEEELKDSELKQAVATTEMESAKAVEEAAQVALEHTEFKAPVCRNYCRQYRLARCRHFCQQAGSATGDTCTG